MVTSKTLSIDIRPYNTAQDRFLTSTAKVFAYVGGLGSGKTYIGAGWSTIMMLTYPGADGLIAANTYKQLETATLPRFFELLDGWGVKYRFNKHDQTIKIADKRFTGTIRCRSLDNYQTLRGAEYAWAWLDETRDTEKEAFDVILGRMRQKIAAKDLVFTVNNAEIRVNKGYTIPSTVDFTQLKLGDLVPTQVRITTTPDMSKAKWLYDYLTNPTMLRELAQRGITIDSAHADTRDNPYLPSDYVNLLESSYNNEMREQELAGRWVIVPDGQPVYGGAFGDIHKGRFSFCNYRTLMIGWDFGFRRPAVTFWQYDDNDRIIGLGELLGENVELAEFCKQVWNYIHQNFTGKLSDEPDNDLDIAVYCDPAGVQKSDKSAKTSIEILRANGFPMVQYKKVRLEDGLMLVRQCLNQNIAGKPSMMFDNFMMPITLEGFQGGYHYPKKKKEFTEEKEQPFKDGYYEHLMDTVRYLVQCLRSPLQTKRPVYEQNKYSWDILDREMGY